jgi:hypothetical protein
MFPTELGSNGGAPASTGAGGQVNGAAPGSWLAVDWGAWGTRLLSPPPPPTGQPTLITWESQGSWENTSMPTLLIFAFDMFLLPHSVCQSSQNSGLLKQRLYCLVGEATMTS